MTVLSFLKFTQRTLSECPEQCNCLLAKEEVMYIQKGEERKLKASVVCSSLNLRELPLVLPPNTIYLRVANNQISSLALLGERRPSYQLLEGLTLSNNSLDSLTGLETSWLMGTGTRLLDV